MATILLFACLIIALLILRSKSRKLKRFPPGPVGLPLVGHLLLLGKYPHKTLLKWKDVYGPIIGIQFGSFRSVVVQDGKLIREAMNLSAFSGRPRLFGIFTAGNGSVPKGIVASDGAHWLEQRRFTLWKLRDFGFGTKTMKTNIQDEVNALLKQFNMAAGKPLQIKNLFNTAVVNVLWIVLFGERLQDDPEITQVIEALTSLFDNGGILASLSMFMPWLKKITPALSSQKQMMNNLDIVHQFLKKQIARHRATHIRGKPRSFVDAYMDQIQQTNDPDSSFHENQGFIVSVLYDLFGAGSESTSNTLSWTCMYLIQNPEVQTKLQNEIDYVVGTERPPFLTDRPTMPYTDAIIKEVLRHSSIATLNLRRAVEDVEFHGYVIPKDTIIIANLYGAHYAENVWKDAKNFRPERFLECRSKQIKHDNFLPFSTGKRVCLGESLATDELFLFITNIFQNFTAFAGNSELPDFDPIVGITLSPKPFEMILQVR